MVAAATGDGGHFFPSPTRLSSRSPWRMARLVTAGYTLPKLYSAKTESDVQESAKPVVLLRKLLNHT